MKIFFKNIAEILYSYRIKSNIDYLDCQKRLSEILKSEYKMMTNFTFSISDSLNITIESDMKDCGIFEYLIYASVVFNESNKIQIHVICIDCQFETMSQQILDF